MEPPHSSGAGASGGGKPPRRPQHKKELQLQGPRPSPLRVSKESQKITKPPHAQHHHAPPPPYLIEAVPLNLDQRQPVIIYSVSPKIIHAQESDFMSIVQRLTGVSPAPGNVSPAARLASIERTSPTTERGATAACVSIGDWDVDIMEMLEGVEMGPIPGIWSLGQIPGILSPGPAALPPIPTGIFSPATEPQNMSIWQDLSPFLQGSFQSPSYNALFSNPTIFSPSPSPSGDLFNLFVQF